MNKIIKTYFNILKGNHLFSVLMCHTLMFPSLNPANNLFPKQFQVKEIHFGTFGDFLTSFPSMLSFY